MLHGIATLNLPRQPRDVHLLSHSMGGVAIATFTYNNNNSNSSGGGAAAAQRQEDEEEFFFSVAEVALPAGVAAPVVKHLRSPVPGHCVETATPLRSADGDVVHLLVQCRCAATGAVQTLLYRRKLLASSGSSAASIALPDEEEAGSGGVGGGVPRRVVYERLPRAVAGARLWTATAAVAATESAAAAAAAAPPPRPLLVGASGGGGAVSALQWVELTGPTRAEVVHAVELPALAGFPVTALVPIPGSAGQRVLLLCHHAVVEVAAEAVVGGGTAVSNVAIRRTWRWSPHDRLTSLCLKGHLLCCGTEDGVVVLWDLRASSQQQQLLANNNNGEEEEEEGEGGVRHIAACRSCPAASAAVVGLCAPLTSSGFVTASLDGSLLSWQNVDDSDALASLAHQQQQQQQQQQHSVAAARRSGVERIQQQHADKKAYRAPAFPYVAAPPGVALDATAPPPKMSILPGTSGCVRAVAEGSLVLIARELGRVELYHCE